MRANSGVVTCILTALTGIGNPVMGVAHRRAPYTIEKSPSLFAKVTVEFYNKEFSNS